MLLSVGLASNPDSGSHAQSRPATNQVEHPSRLQQTATRVPAIVTLTRSEYLLDSSNGGHDRPGVVTARGENGRYFMVNVSSQEIRTATGLHLACIRPGGWCRLLDAVLAIMSEPLCEWPLSRHRS